MSSSADVNWETTNWYRVHASGKMSCLPLMSYQSNSQEIITCLNWNIFYNISAVIALKIISNLWQETADISGLNSDNFIKIGPEKTPKRIFHVLKRPSVWICKCFMWKWVTFTQSLNPPSLSFYHNVWSVCKKCRKSLKCKIWNRGLTAHFHLGPSIPHSNCSFCKHFSLTQNCSIQQLKQFNICSLFHWCSGMLQGLNIHVFRVWIFMFSVTLWAWKRLSQIL